MCWANILDKPIKFRNFGHYQNWKKENKSYFIQKRLVE